MSPCSLNPVAQKTLMLRVTSRVGMDLKALLKVALDGKQTQRESGRRW